jgi:hypothetical protein
MVHNRLEAAGCLFHTSRPMEYLMIHEVAGDILLTKAEAIAHGVAPYCSDVDRGGPGGAPGALASSSAANGVGARQPR